MRFKLEAYEILFSHMFLDLKALASANVKKKGWRERFDKNFKKRLCFKKLKATEVCPNANALK